MHKRLLLIILIALFGTKTYAGEGLVVPTDTVVVYGYSSEHEVVGKTMLDNNGSETLTVVWKRIKNEFPSTWLGNGSQICDINLCWVDTVDSRSFEFVPGMKANLDVHFQNNFNTGDGIVQLLVYVEGDSANTATVITYKAFVDEPTSVWDRNNGDKNQIRIFPNPARDHIMFKKLPDVPARTIELYNILGRKLKTYTLSNNQNNYRIELDDLPKGVYMIRIYDNDYRLIHTKSISKH